LTNVEVGRSMVDAGVEGIEVADELSEVHARLSIFV
jgi:hypothetical protein